MAVHANVLIVVMALLATGILFETEIWLGWGMYQYECDKME